MPSLNCIERVLERILAAPQDQRFVAETFQFAGNRLRVLRVQAPEVAEQGVLAFLARPWLHDDFECFWCESFRSMDTPRQELPHHADEYFETHRGFSAGRLQGLELGNRPGIEADGVGQY